MDIDLSQLQEKLQELPQYVLYGAALIILGVILVVTGLLLL